MSGRWTAAAVLAAGIAALAVGTSSMPAFLVLAGLGLLGTGYSAFHWPRATLVGVAITTLLDPGVAIRFLPRSLADGPIGISEPLLAVTGIVVLTRVSREGIRVAVTDPTIVLAALFTALCVVSAFANGVPPHVAALGMLMTIDAMVIYVLWRALGASAEVSGGAAAALVAAGVVVAVFGIGQVLLAPDLLGFERFALFPGDVGRITSFLGNPNLLAPVLAFLAPFPLFATVRVRDRRWRTLAVIASLALLMALLLTFSRGAWIAAATGFALAALLLDRRALLAAGAFIAIAVTAVVFMPTHLVASDAGATASVTGAIGTISAPGGPEGTDAEDQNSLAGLSSEEIRLRFLRDGLRIVRENPLFGVGPGRYGGAAATIFPSPVYEEYGTTIGHFRTVHNFWLHLAGEGGVPGVTVFLAIVTALVIRLVRAARLAEGVQFVVLAGSAAAVLIVAINNLTEMVLEGNIPAVLVWLIFAVGAGLAPDPQLGWLSRGSGPDS